MSLLYKTYQPFERYPAIVLSERRDKRVIRLLRWRFDSYRERLALFICPWASV